MSNTEVKQISTNTTTDQNVIVDINYQNISETTLNHEYQKIAKDLPEVFQQALVKVYGSLNKITYNNRLGDIIFLGIQLMGVQSEFPEYAARYGLVEATPDLFFSVFFSLLNLMGPKDFYALLTESDDSTRLWKKYLRLNNIDPDTL